ncbi:EAL domain-containing protein [Granulosicoccaceae sp. 1_MG-2023]|nr:EAL domain-containing protein [Granulosicoccaceae sp. 1_MG-2023]
MKILLIDDDKVDRTSIVRTLRDSCYPIETEEVSDAEEGIREAARGGYDLVLLDYQLPAMTGLDVLNAMRETPDSGTAIIMLSHHDDEALAMACIEAGAQDFIPKHEVSVPRLTRAILHARERHRMEMDLRESHEKLRCLAEQDPLTGLANRYVFENALDNALPQAARKDASVALLLLDLDKFKHVNDTLGHVAGDSLLMEVAQRLQAKLRSGDLLCRIGGDEFAIIVHDLDRVCRLRQFTRRLLEALHEPVSINNAEVVVTASVGVATYPECAPDTVSLLKSADVALYRSKENGRNQICFYSHQLHEQVHQRIELERDLRHAMARSELELYYQPQFSADDGVINGTEALIRWNHPTRGLISPNEFIPIAEETGLIVRIGEWVIEEACSQLSRWHQDFPLMQGVPMAVNLSAVQLSTEAFAATVAAILEHHAIAPQCLELELTESAIAENPQVSGRTLSKLSDIGVRLALDDFGTGYSSLQQLHRHPFQVLKIDKSFIQSSTSNDASFLEAIHDFTRTLGLEVVAEGVETLAQRELCERLRFDRLQGFYFACPMTRDEFGRWLAASTGTGQVTALP